MTAIIEPLYTNQPGNTYASDKSLLLQLRDTAKAERDDLVRFNLRLIADELNVALQAFAGDPTGDKLARVNGHFAAGVRMLDFASKRNGGAPGNGAGLKEGALLAKVA